MVFYLRIPHVVPLSQKFCLHRILHHSLCDLEGVFKNEYSKNSIIQTLEHYIYCDYMSYTCWAIFRWSWLYCRCARWGTHRSCYWKAKLCPTQPAFFFFFAFIFHKNVACFLPFFSPQINPESQIERGQSILSRWVWSTGMCRNMPWLRLKEPLIWSPWQVEFS
jgi:hypothetical protein